MDLREEIGYGFRRNKILVNHIRHINKYKVSLNKKMNVFIFAYMKPYMPYMVKIKKPHNSVRLSIFKKSQITFSLSFPFLLLS